MPGYFASTDSMPLVRSSSGEEPSGPCRMTMFPLTAQAFGHHLHLLGAGGDVVRQHGGGDRVTVGEGGVDDDDRDARIFAARSCGPSESAWTGTMTIALTRWLISWST